MYKEISTCEYYVYLVNVLIFHLNKRICKKKKQRKGDLRISLINSKHDLRVYVDSYRRKAKQKQKNHYSYSMAISR